jgi:hypothetical protein
MDDKQKLDFLTTFVKSIANAPKTCLCGVKQINPKDNIPKGTCIRCKAEMLLDCTEETE